jgi:glycosyltransferase involved in cell wall biosynthesis
VRVLIVTVVHDPEDARIRHRELEALLRADAQVTYAAPFTAYGRQMPDGVTGIDLPRSVGRHRLPAIRAARSMIRKQARDHDVILLHDPELLAAVAGLRRRRGPVVVWDVHEDTAAALSLKGWLPRPARPLAALTIHLAEAWAERRVKLLLAEDSYVKRFRRGHPVVPNSVIVPPEPPPAPGQDRAVYVGRLTSARGALDMVELGRLLEGQVRVELVGTADSEVSAQLRQAHREGWVHHHGFLPNAQALTLLDGALAGLSLLHDEPNYAHSRPTKAMEYMAHGIPVVTTPNAVSVDLVERYHCGVVVPFEDPEAAAKTLLELRADDHRRREMGANGRAAALRDLDWSRDGERFNEMLREWVGQLRPSTPARRAAHGA